MQAWTIIQVIHCVPHVTSGKGQYLKHPLQQQQWSSIHKPGEDREKEENNVLSDLRLLITPSLYHLSSSVWPSRLCRLCPHPPTVTIYILSATSFLKQTHIHLLYKTRLCTGYEPVPKYPGAGLELTTQTLPSMLETQKSPNGSWFQSIHVPPAALCEFSEMPSSVWWDWVGHIRGEKWASRSCRLGSRRRRGMEEQRGGWWWVCSASVDGWVGIQQGFKWRLTPQG